MKANGATTKQRDKVLFGMLKAMSIKVNSETIWQMAMASTHTSMVLNTRENSEMMSKKDMEKKGMGTRLKPRTKAESWNDAKTCACACASRESSDETRSVYWEAAKGKEMLGNGRELLKKMLNYDKDNMDPAMVAVVSKQTANPDFNPEFVKKGSVACAGVCSWITAMMVYDRVAKNVAPKKAAAPAAKAAPPRKAAAAAARALVGL